MIENAILILETSFWFVIALSLIVFIHEFGHYIVARMCNVRIEIFSIGFGKELAGFTDRHGTRWKLSILPLGGYVKMLGDATAASSPDFPQIAAMTDEEKSKAFYYKPLWQKALVVFAGPFANYLLTIFIFILMFLNYGKLNISNELGEVLKDTPAYYAGLETGDIVTGVDGEIVHNFNELREMILLNTGQEITLKIKRGNDFLEKKITPKMEQIDDGIGGKTKIARIGVVPKSSERIKLKFMDAVYEGHKQAIDLSVSILKGLKQIILGQRGSDEIGGPIKIAKYTKYSADQGIVELLWFTALISMNLAVLNLLPIPLLDGGHLLYYACEAVLRKPLPIKIQNFGFRIGFAVLVFLMIFAMFNDIKSFF